MVLGAIDFLRAPRPIGPSASTCRSFIRIRPTEPSASSWTRSPDSRCRRGVITEGLMAKKPLMLRRLAEEQGLSGWDEARWDALRRTYIAMVARVDRQFAMLVGALKETGLYDDTAIFAFSDHGDYTGDYGVVEKSQVTFEDPLTRVPLDRQAAGRGAVSRASAAPPWPSSPMLRRRSGT